MALEAVVIGSNGKRHEYEVARMASEKVIVRASNPGQFEADNEPPWTRDLTSETLYHMGKKIKKKISTVYKIMIEDLFQVGSQSTLMSVMKP